MWALPRAWSYARACTRPCFLSSVFFSCGVVPDGDEFAEAELLVWTTSPTAGSLQIRKGVPSLSASEVELLAHAPAWLRGTARDGKEALVASPTRAQQSEPYATLWRSRGPERPRFCRFHTCTKNSHISLSAARQRGAQNDPAPGGGAPQEAPRAPRRGKAGPPSRRGGPTVSSKHGEAPQRRRGVAVEDEAAGDERLEDLQRHA